MGATVHPVPDSVEPEHNAETADLLREAREEKPQPLARRHALVEWAIGLPFVAAAIAIGVLSPGSTEWDAQTAVLLVAAYALATTARLEFGSGGTDPSLVVLVPMFFLLPAGWVPLLAMAGFALGRLPDYLRGRVHPGWAVTTLGNGWHSVGPALVLSQAGPGRATFEDLPLYLAAALAYVVLDVTAGLVREWALHGVRPELQLRFFVEIYSLDAVFAPLGLLIAMASERHPAAIVLAAPLAVLLAAYARERQTRLGHALALSEERSDRLEAELAAERGRAEVLASISHGLQTPLASIVGLSGAMARREDGGDQLAVQLQRDALRLRHLVRQVLDFQALQKGEDLRVAGQRVEAADVARDVGAQLPGRVEVVGTGQVLADRARLQQVLTALVLNAVAASAPEDPVVVRVVPRGERTSVEVADRGPGVPPAMRPNLFGEQAAVRDRDESAGTGIGLYVARGIVAAMGGDLRAEFPDGGGSVFAVDLPAVRDRAAAAPADETAEPRP